MKAKITKPDGCVIELDGTAEEIARVVGAPPIQLVPYYVPAPPTVAPYVPFSPYSQPIDPFNPYTVIYSTSTVSS